LFGRDAPAELAPVVVESRTAGVVGFEFVAVDVVAAAPLPELTPVPLLAIKLVAVVVLGTVIDDSVALVELVELTELG
jgi:hypothetical protein